MSALVGYEFFFFSRIVDTAYMKIFMSTITDEHDSHGASFTNM